MGCAVSAPKVKESKSPARKVAGDTGNSVSGRRPATGSTAAAQSVTVATAPPAPVVAAPVPSSEAPPKPSVKEQPSLGKVPSGRLKPSAQAPVQQEEVPEKKKEASSRTTTNAVSRPIPKSLEGEQVAAGWPSWLASVAGEAIKGWVPRRADSFEKLDKIGQGTYSNVYKARDLESGKLVALKKVRFDNLEPESVRFMAREIEVLRRLDHPNIVQLEGLVTSRMSSSLYLVFEYMEHDLAGLAASPGITFAEEQVKCYMQQLLRGLEHCHTNGVLHRDIKGSNLLLDNSGILKIADFGLATFYRPEQNVPLTSRVVTLWYRPPELLLGATTYGVAVDLWSAGCILAELLAGKPIMPGRTEVEQLHKIFKLCGSPSEEYWRKSKLPHATIFKPSQPYKRNLKEIFKDFSPTSLALLDILLAIEPADRGSATAALSHEFFTTEPLPCDPSSLPEYPPSKEYDAKLRDEEARRNKAAGPRARGAVNDKEKRNTTTSLLQQPPQQRQSKAVPAPSANAELSESIAIQKQQMSKQTSGPVAKSSSERFTGDGSQGGGGAGTSGVSSAQFKSIDTPESVVPGGRPADRHLHRTGTNTRLGSLGGAGGPANLSASWVGQAGQPGNGGASIGKYPPGAPGADIGDRAMSMVRVSNKGPSKELAGGLREQLQAGDVSFTQQKKVETGEHGGFGVARNRAQAGEEKDLDLTFQGNAPQGGKQGATLGPAAPRPPALGAAAAGSGGGSSSSRKSGPLGSRDKVDPKTWMLTQATGELPAGVAEALAAAREGAGSGAAGAEAGLSRSTSGIGSVSRNGLMEASPRSKDESARPRSRGRDMSPTTISNEGRDRPPGLVDGSPRGKGLADGSPRGKGAVEVSPRGQGGSSRGKGEPPPDPIAARAKKLSGVAASSSFVVGPRK